MVKKPIPEINYRARQNRKKKGINLEKQREYKK
jgi:hypothetical protein